MTSASTNRVRARPDVRDDRGFTLIEVMVSFVIFAIVASAATLAVVNGISTSKATSDRVGAANVAQQELEHARAMPRASLAAAPTATSTTTVGNNAFTTTRTIAYAPAGSACPTTIATDAPHKITVNVVVSWPGSHGRTVQMGTVLAC
jgi:prepilin-type N-terminal cleavage/methylation domain-containing protein